MIRAKLAKAGIPKPDPRFLQQILRDKDMRATSAYYTQLAVDNYESFANTVSSKTKAFLNERLHLHINGPIKPNFPHLLTAHEEDGTMKLVKIFIPTERPLMSRTGVPNEMEIAAAAFTNNALVPMRHETITITQQQAEEAGCRAGKYEALVMPRYTNVLSAEASGNRNLVARECARLVRAVGYLHSQGVVHMDIKADNVFLDNTSQYHLGDFGSCVHRGERVTSCTVHYLFENPMRKTAHPIYDWFMLLVLILSEGSKEGRWSFLANTLKRTPDCEHADFAKVMDLADSEARNDTPFGQCIADLAARVRAQEVDFRETREMEAKKKLEEEFGPDAIPLSSMKLK